MWYSNFYNTGTGDVLVRVFGSYKVKYIETPKSYVRYVKSLNFGLKYLKPKGYSVKYVETPKSYVRYVKPLKIKIIYKCKQ